MRGILSFQSIDRSYRPEFCGAVPQGVTRTIMAVACCFAVLTAAPVALAATVSDQEMANRYERAAQAGDDDAQFYLGAFHSAGAGRQRSDQEAFRWFQRAADQGHSHAMLLVAGLYASGRGITKDNLKAYRWAYIVASATKVEEDRNGARQLMSLLMKRMTSDEIGQAVVAARSWRAVRVAGTAKASTIERAADSSVDQLAPTAPPPPPAVAQQAPATPPAAVSQPATSSIAVLPAPSKPAPPAAPTKNANAQNLLDQVPQGLRKRFGF